jgi:putative membrane protein
MDENPITHPGVPEEVYHTMGRKTFWMFLMQRIHAAAILLLLSIALFVVSQQAFLATIVPGVSLASYVWMAAWICLALFAVALAIIVFTAWLVYSNYKFCLGEDSLKIKRGILNKEEVAIPYRQIQDVDIKRDLSFQMMGLSRIVIITAGHEEDEKPGDDDTEGILPALDKDLAEWMQAELLKRANVQKVTEEKEA